MKDEELAPTADGAETIAPAERERDALSTIKNHAMTAMGIGILPVPGLDLVALTGVPLNLLRQLGGMYGHSLSDELGKKLIGSLLSGYLPLAVAAPVASMLKFIPGVGIMAGVLAQSSLAGATTYAIGMQFLQHFETGGSFFDFKASKQKFQQQVAEGREMLKRTMPGGARSKAD
jgi:uncharacterized protein (DUF697 family)